MRYIIKIIQQSTCNESNPRISYHRLPHNQTPKPKDRNELHAIRAKNIRNGYNNHYLPDTIRNSRLKDEARQPVQHKSSQKHGRTYANTSGIQNIKELTIKHTS